MILNASKTKAMISRSRTINPQSPPLTIGGTVLKESADLVIFGVTFDSKIEKHLRSGSRAASQRLGILRKSFRVFHDIYIVSWGDAFVVLFSRFLSTVLQCGARLPIHTLNYWTVQLVQRKKKKNLYSMKFIWFYNVYILRVK